MQKKHRYKMIIIKYTYGSYESISECIAKELKKQKYDKKDES